MRTLFTAEESDLLAESKESGPVALIVSMALKARLDDLAREGFAGDTEKAQRFKSALVRYAIAQYKHYV